MFFKVYILQAFISVLANIQPYFDIKDLGETYSSWEHNLSFFKYISTENNIIYIGARNSLYGLPIENIYKNYSEIHWPVEHSCQQLNLCNNHIELMVKIYDNSLFLCGTYGGSPACQIFERKEFGDWSKKGSLINGNGIISTFSMSIFSFKGGIFKCLYTASFDHHNHHPLIQAKFLNNETVFLSDKNSEMLFKKPDFKSMFEFNEKMYLFFNEESLDHENYWSVSLRKSKEIGRIARICLRDHGHFFWELNDHTKYFTTYFKTQLLCSIEDSISNNFIIFNKIVAISSLGFTKYLYALMKYESPLVRFTAVCVYQMDNVERVFATGRQISQKKCSNGVPYWKNVNDEELAKNGIHDNVTECNVPRASAAAEFILANPLISEAVQPLGNHPLTIFGDFTRNRHGVPNSKRSDQYHVHSAIGTAFEVVFGVKAADGSLHDIVLIGTENGAVVKIALPSVTEWPKSKKLPLPVLIETVQVLKPGRSIEKLVVSHRLNQMMAIHSEQIATVPLTRCEFFKSCVECVLLKDPLCSWSLSEEKCTLSENGLANMSSGVHKKCSSFHHYPKESSNALESRDKPISLALFLGVLFPLFILTFASALFVGYKYALKVNRCSDKVATLTSCSNNVGHVYGRNVLLPKVSRLEECSVDLNNVGSCIAISMLGNFGDHVRPQALPNEYETSTSVSSVPLRTVKNQSIEFKKLFDSTIDLWSDQHRMINSKSFPVDLQSKNKDIRHVTNQTVWLQHLLNAESTDSSSDID